MRQIPRDWVDREEFEPIVRRVDHEQHRPVGRERQWPHLAAFEFHEGATLRAPEEQGGERRADGTMVQSEGAEAVSTGLFGPG
jgi:hypothetical protein